jgi:hypothetical protein
MLREAAEPAPERRAVAAGYEVDRVDEVAVDHRAQAAVVVEPRDVHAVDVDARVLRRRAPHHELARAERGARDAGQVLDDAQHVALRAGHLRGLLRRHRRRHDLLAQRRRDDDQLEVVALASVVVRLVGLHVVGRLEALAGLERLFGAQRGELRAR